MLTNTVDKNVLQEFPKELQIAQEAINTKEVQAMIKALGKHNLGVYMPHMHKNGENFYVLPKDMIALEDAGVTSFILRDTVAESSHRIATAWRWNNEDNDVSVSSRCGGQSGLDNCIGTVVAASLI